MTTATPKDVSQIKRHVAPGEMLILAEHDGTMWASNRYWLAPAAWLAQFLDWHDITGPASGSSAGP